MNAERVIDLIKQYAAHVGLDRHYLHTCITRWQTVLWFIISRWKCILRKQIIKTIPFFNKYNNHKLSDGKVSYIFCSVQLRREKKRIKFPASSLYDAPIALQVPDLIASEIVKCTSCVRMIVWTKIGCRVLIRRCIPVNRYIYSAIFNKIENFLWISVCVSVNEFSSENLFILKEKNLIIPREGFIYF